MLQRPPRDAKQGLAAAHCALSTPNVMLHQAPLPAACGTGANGKVECAGFCTQVAPRFLRIFIDQTLTLSRLAKRNGMEDGMEWIDWRKDKWNGMDGGMEGMEEWWKDGLREWME